MKNLLGIIGLFIGVCMISYAPIAADSAKEETTIEHVYIYEEPIEVPVVKQEVIQTDIEDPEIYIWKPWLTEEEIWLIGWITMGEAEGESIEGKRLVIDTILNRMDSEKFPDTINDVIFQDYAFSCVGTDRLNRLEPTDEVLDLVIDEMKSRTNDDVIFFNANHYSIYGEPLFIVGNHYFSSL